MSSRRRDFSALKPNTLPIIEEVRLAIGQSSPPRKGRGRRLYKPYTDPCRGSDPPDSISPDNVRKGLADPSRPPSKWLWKTRLLQRPQLRRVRPVLRYESEHA